MKSQLQHITSISLSLLINKLPIMWQLAKKNIRRTCRLGLLLTIQQSTCVRLLKTRPRFSGHAVSHAVAGFVYYLAYCNTPWTMKSGSLIDWLQQWTNCWLNTSQTIDRLHWLIVKVRSGVKHAILSEADFSGLSHVNKYSCLKYKYKYPSLKYEYKYKYWDLKYKYKYFKLVLEYKYKYQVLHVWHTRA